MPSFTAQVPNLQTIGPVVEARIAIGSFLEARLKQNNQSIPAAVSVRAIIDTGATGTVIRDDIPLNWAFSQLG